MGTSSIPAQFTEAELKLLQVLVYQECGMHFDERRTHFLQDRLQRRLKECHLDSFYSYYRLLISKEGKDELARLLENLTVNETSFFRNKAQLDLFHKHILDDLIRRKQAQRDYSLRIWSAGCSTGQEPYTLAMLIADSLAYYYLRNPQSAAMASPKPLIPPPWKVEIIASDISYSVLRTAQEGTYSETQMASVDYSYRLRYFDKTGDRYAIKKALKEIVHFDFHNLKTEYLPQRNDVIFCRNVMMYFDEPEQKRLAGKVRALSQSPGLPVRGPRGKPAGPDRQIHHGASQQRDRLPEGRGERMTQFPDERAAEMRELFFESAQELLQALNEEALKLEKRPGDAELVRGIRRIVHTLKGDAAACGFRELSNAAHDLEDALALESASSHGSLAEVAFTAADTFGAMLAAYRRKGKLPSAAPLAKMIRELTQQPKGKKALQEKDRQGGRRPRCLDRVREAGDPECGERRQACVPRHRRHRSQVRDADRSPATGAECPGPGRRSPGGASRGRVSGQHPAPGIAGGQRQAIRSVVRPLPYSHCDIERSGGGGKGG